MENIFDRIDNNIKDYYLHEHAIYINDNIVKVTSLSKSLFTFSDHTEVQVYFANYLNRLLDDPAYPICKMMEGFFDFAAYLSSIARNEDLYRKLLTLSGKDELILGMFSKPGQLKIRSADELSDLEYFFLNQRIIAHAKSDGCPNEYDLIFSLWLGFNLLSISSEIEVIDRGREYIPHYIEMTEDQRQANSVLERGRGQSKDTRKEIYYQLKASEEYNDLSVHIDNQLVYLYSSSKKEVIFTTNMDYQRYEEIMESHKAHTIVMANTESLRMYSCEQDFGQYDDDVLRRVFVKLTKIKFSQKLLDFREKERALELNNHRMKYLLSAYHKLQGIS